nr:uncharacterized protein LOC111416149 [Onthophagus taurus]
MILIEDCFGNKVRARALLDSGSTANYLTESLTRKLRLKTEEKLVKISGVNGSSSWVKNIATTTVASERGKFATTLSFLIISKITENIPAVKLCTSEFKLPGDVHLADPRFFISRKIDILLGAQIFYELILDGQIKLDTITLRESHFGWLVTGTLPTVNHVTCHQTFHNVNNIEISVEKWWEMDDAGEETDFSLEELKCEKSFKDSTRRNKDGRFIVGNKKIS